MYYLRIKSAGNSLVTILSMNKAKKKDVLIDLISLIRLLMNWKSINITNNGDKCIRLNHYNILFLFGRSLFRPTCFWFKSGQKNRFGSEYARIRKKFQLFLGEKNQSVFLFKFFEKKDEYFLMFFLWIDQRWKNFLFSVLYRMRVNS